MVFRAPKIKTCCFCMSLKTGSYITGGLELLAFVFGLVMAATLTNSVLQLGTNDLLSYNQVLYYYTVFLNVGVFSFVLMWGLIKKNHVLMFPWILQQSVFLLFLLSSLFGNTVYHGLMSDRPEDLAVEIVAVVIVGYTLLVVYNYYRELKERQAEETN